MENNILIKLTTLLVLISVICSCPNNCLFCLKKQKCITCQNFYFLTQESACIPKSIQNCRVYSQMGKCSVCQPSFRVENNLCLKDISGCIIRDKNGLCQECGFGTTLNIKGQCLGVINCQLSQKQCKSCRKGYKLVNNKCIYSGSDCQVMILNGLCTQCKQGFILNGFECVSKGSNSVKNGKVSYIQKCGLYSRNQNNCLQCQKGYSLFSNACKSNGQVYNRTLGYANVKIRQFSSEAYIDNPSQFIKYEKVTYSLNNRRDDVLGVEQKLVQRVMFQGVGKRHSQQDNCLIRVAGSLACSVCVDGYYYFNGLCKQKTQVCLKFNHLTNKCLNCHQKFVLINGECLDASCEEYLYASCKKCKKGYFISQQGYCFDPNCIIVNLGVCSKCVQGYQLNQSTLCNKVIAGCQSYGPQKAVCTKCIINYILGPDGQCKRPQDDRCLRYGTTINILCQQCKDNFALVGGYCVGLYCKSFSSAQKCQTCQPGYTLDKSLYCYDQMCASYSKGTCLKCATNYKLQDGLCVNILLGCLKIQPSTQKCSKCIESLYRLQQQQGACLLIQKDRCIKYFNNVCVQCKDQYALLGGKCVNLLCQKQLFTNNFYACTKCKSSINITSQGLCFDSNCYQTTNGSCIWCTDKYIIGSNGLCVSTTSNTTSSTVDKTQQLKPQQINKPLFKPDLNCKSYDQKNNCLRCQGRYFIRSGKCQYVSQACKIYNTKTGNCTTCENGYAPYSEQSTYQNCDKKITTPDNNCLIKNIQMFCIKCKSNYFIKTGFCYPADTLCRTFNLYGGQCLTCYEGYILQSNRCVPLTQQSRCKAYDFQNVCVQCQDRFYVDKGVCKQVNTTCLAYQMSTGLCLTCINGYLPSNGTCIKGKESIPNCKLSNQVGNCVQCVNRYYLQSPISACKLVNPLCNNYNKNTGYCLSCSQEYKIRPDLGLCVLLSSDDLCSVFSQKGTCTKCQDGHQLNSLSHKCIKLNPLCQSYSLTVQCQKCKDPYYLSFKQCIPKSKRQSLDSNCLAGDAYNFCVKCRDRYYINSGTCLKASDLCKTFNSFTGGCQSCYQGLFISQKKQCVSSVALTTVKNCQLYSGTLCIKCKAMYYLSQKASIPKCTIANPLCKTFNEFNGNCFTCVEGYLLSNGQCVINNKNSQGVTTPKKYIQVSQINCKQYDPQNKICVTCYNSYYYSSVQSVCKSVNSNCRTYSSFNGLCLTCFQGYNLTSGKCLISSSTTPLYSIKQPSDRLLTVSSIVSTSAKTLNNKPNCFTYDQSTNNCITCVNGYTLDQSTGSCWNQSPTATTDPYCTSMSSQNKCLNCITGYYIHHLAAVCTLQSVLCAQYNMFGGQCYKCKAGGILQQGMCLKPALRIDQHCSYYKEGFCSKCVQGFKLVRYTCEKQ